MMDDHSLVTSQELQYRKQVSLVNEAGRAVLGAAPLSKKDWKKKWLVWGEIKERDVNLYQKMYQRLGLYRSMIQRMAELVMEVDMEVRPPRHVVQGDMEPTDVLLENIAFVRKWQRYVKFYTWLKRMLESALWAGDSYAEIVYEEELGRGEPARGSGWKITALKIIPPDEMRVVRDVYGDVLGYLQYPFRGSINSLTVKDAVKYMAAGAVVFEKEQVLHFRIDVEPGEAYGTSKAEALKDILAIVVGMREDIGMTVHNYAAPTILFRVGTELIPATAETVQDVRDKIETQLAVSSNIVTSSMVTGEVIGAGKSVMNMEGYLKMMLAILFGSFGLPEILLGQGSETTEATAKMQLEAVAKQVRSIHQVIKDEIELKLFTYLCLEKHDYLLRPGEMDRIPELWFGPVETEEDKRIRLENMYRFGGTGLEEWRKEYGMKPRLEGTPTIEQDRDFIMKLEKQKGKIALEQAEAKQAAMGAGTGKPKPTQKKSDRDAEHGKAAASTTGKKK